MHETASRTPVCMQACMYICTCMCMMMMMMVMSVVLATVHRIVNATRSHDKKAFASLSVLHFGVRKLRTSLTQQNQNIKVLCCVLLCVVFFVFQARKVANKKYSSSQTTRCARLHVRDEEMDNTGSWSDCLSQALLCQEGAESQIDAGRGR